MLENYINYILEFHLIYSLTINQHFYLFIFIFILFCFSILRNGKEKEKGK